MENLLLVLDEIDDVFAMLGLVWRSIFSFLLAIAAFVATGFVFLKIPFVVAFLAVTLLILGGIDELRSRQMSQPAAAIDA
ncbi:MAG: hypothetical protein H7Y02_06905 [Candidatus Obscuribacterales bacterium]|nr:hypothetical protein [Steroidobacteraceae bacterium]